MKGYDQINELINQAHAEAAPIATSPIIALVARSAQSMRESDCQVTIGSGSSTLEAVNAALAKTGRMKDWVVVVSQLGEDGNHVMPPVMCHEPMHALMKVGLNAVFYVKPNGDWEVYTPN